MHLDLFSGIGGFALAAQWVWGGNHHVHSFIENDPFYQKVLRKHWPGVPIHSDIKDYKHDGTKITLLTGGFPCQGFSVAGKRKGKKDDRYLWPEMLEVIKEANPAWVVGENVTGIVNMALDTVLSDLEAEGYETQTFIIPACAVDAPHRRDRVWIVAYSDRNGTQRDKSENGERRRVEQNGKIVSNPDSSGRKKQRRAGPDRKKHSPAECTGEDVADPQKRRWNRETQQKLDDKEGEGKSGCRPNNSSQDVANTSSQRPQVREGQTREGGQAGFRFESADEPSRRWLPEPELGRVAYGIPDRTHRLKALGNAIVPQVVAPIFQAIKEIEEGKQRLLNSNINKEGE